MSIYKIYKITNAVNGKVYIGQTKDSLHRRFQGHCWKSSGCIKLKHAIQKYGKENFYIEEIDHAESVAEVNHKEVFWIDYYKSQDNRFGYNILQGGVICKYNRKKVMCLDTGEIYISATSAAKDIGKCSGNLISEACIGRNITAYGMRWAFVDKNNLPVLPRIKKNIKPLRLKIKCLETGEIFNSIADAARQYKKTPSLFNCYFNGRVKSIGGLHFEYLDQKYNKTNKKIIREKRNRKKIPVICLETGEVFDSVLSAAKRYSVYRSSIYDAIDYGHRCKGLHFNYYKKGDIREFV